MHLVMCLSLKTNDHHKGWLTYSGGTDRPGEIYYNFSEFKLVKQNLFAKILEISEEKGPSQLKNFLDLRITLQKR